MTRPAIRHVLWFALASLVIVATVNARAETQVSIVSTEPAADATLAIGESFYVRVAYTSDEPVSLWARPYFNGNPVEQALTNASEKYTGSGAALGWFALNNAGEVDEVRIIAGGGKPYVERMVASKPLQLRWSSGGSVTDNSAQWVDELRSDAAQRDRERAQQRASEPVPIRDVALFNGFMLLVLAVLLASIGVPLWSLWKWRGGWRIAAAVPAAMMVFVVLRIVVDTARDPTSHNLWPFEIAMFGAIAMVSIVVLKAARRFMGVRP